MIILINNKSGQPIYEQIYSQIKNQIIGGDLKENESLPSIRALAKDLRISVITTKRAYEELDRDGYIYTLPGKGSFVAQKNLLLVNEEYMRQIENHFDEIRKLSAAVKLSKEDLHEMLDTLWEEQDERG
ncbi:MAG: GntR family transcriptional regulator [Solobacterium sp.]|nr:GntR family transcriptional regulator [Solobacterium sp.]